MAIERELMRSCLLEAMRRNPRTQYENLKLDVGVVAAERGLDVHDWNGRKSLRPEDHRRLLEMIWALITEGVMTVGFEHNESWPFVSLTEYGEQHVKGGQPHRTTLPITSAAWRPQGRSTTLRNATSHNRCRRTRATCRTPQP
jgi:hypothetical protein